jgi:hypothetical protein
MGLGDKAGLKGPPKDPLDSAGEEAAVLKSKLPNEKPLLFSDWRRNASNSGFWSTGTTRGEAAAVERTFEDGGLQLVRMCWAALEAKQSAVASIWRPK